VFLIIWLGSLRCSQVSDSDLHLEVDEDDESVVFALLTLSHTQV